MNYLQELAKAIDSLTAENKALREQVEHVVLKPIVSLPKPDRVEEINGKICFIFKSKV